MGDISTHKEINLHVIPQLEAINPQENYTYVEFGNFLTDISQFRDPPNYISGKKRIGPGAVIGAVIDEIPLLKRLVGAKVLCGQLGSLSGIGNLREWLDVMFGGSGQDRKRHGALPTFFQHLCRAVAHIMFADDSDHYDRRLRPLTPTEIDRVYDFAYTQYYPHEHLDYPPFRRGINVDSTRPYMPLSRGVMGYLEMQIQYVVEELSQLEIELVESRNLEPAHPTRSNLLVRLGHILHAVEDFHMHSNAIELYQWTRVSQDHPERKPKENQEDYHFLIDNCLNDTGGVPSSVGLRRRLVRRLRYPFFYDPGREDEWGKKPDRFYPEISRFAIDFCYTGMFGDTDIAHTVSGGLESLEQSFQQHHPSFSAAIPGINIPLIKALLIEEERRKLTLSCQHLADQIAKHKQQLLSAD